MDIQDDAASHAFQEENRVAQKRGKARFAWLRLNAYGLLLDGLLFLAVLQITDPKHAPVAQLVGHPPALQNVWIVGYGVTAVLLLWGFVTAKIGPEMAGLFTLFMSLTAQTGYVTISLWGSWMVLIPELLRWAVIVGCVLLRASALLDPEGMTVTIPGRGDSS